MHELIGTFSNTAHLHLILNHVPTVGFGVALALFLAGQIRKNDALTHASLVLFFCVAVVSIATYLSGSAAAYGLLNATPAPGFVVPQAIRAHEDAALPAFVFMEITGFSAWLALWQWRRAMRLASGYFTTILILSIVTFGLMARAADLGGAIHHPEILEVAAAQADQTSESAGDTGWVKSFGEDFVHGVTWVWPTLETLHFVGLSMMFIVVLVVDLRVLGMIKNASCAAVYQLLPFGILGFGLNLITGMMFFIGEPAQYVHNSLFYWKMVFVILGGLNVAYFMLDESLWNVKAGDDAPLSSKIAAASAIFIWVAVLFCGHMLPFLGNAF